jgi:RNA polymerase sigma factor (sigma-70 family)
MDRDREDALERLVSQYSALIRNVVFRVAGRAADSLTDDVEQRVRIALWRQTDREQSITYPASYIYRIAVRETVRAVRQELRLPTESLEAGDSRPADTTANPHASLERTQVGDQIRAAVAGLSIDRRRAVKAHLAGFDVREVMRMYGWDYQKARNLIARGMADLRIALSKFRGHSDES